MCNRNAIWSGSAHSGIGGFGRDSSHVSDPAGLITVSIRCVHLVGVHLDVLRTVVIIGVREIPLYSMLSQLSGVLVAVLLIPSGEHDCLPDGGNSSCGFG